AGKTGRDFAGTQVDVDAGVVGVGEVQPQGGQATLDGAVHGFGMALVVVGVVFRRYLLFEDGCCKEAAGVGGDLVAGPRPGNDESACVFMDDAAVGGGVVGEYIGLAAQPAPDELDAVETLGCQ